MLILSRRKKNLWQKTGSFSLYFSKLKKKKEIQRARIAKEKKIKNESS
jgi:hypothetical protein